MKSKKIPFNLILTNENSAPIIKNNCLNNDDEEQAKVISEKKTDCDSGKKASNTNYTQYDSNIIKSKSNIKSLEQINYKNSCNETTTQMENGNQDFKLITSNLFNPKVIYSYLPDASNKVFSLAAENNIYKFISKNSDLKKQQTHINNFNLLNLSEKPKESVNSLSHSKTKSQECQMKNSQISSFQKVKEKNEDSK